MDAGHSSTLPPVLSRLRARILMLGHFDLLPPSEYVKKRRETLPRIDTYAWPPGQDFNCGQRGDYDADAASKALRRTIGFLKRRLA